MNVIDYFREGTISYHMYAFEKIEALKDSLWKGNFRYDSYSSNNKAVVRF